MKNYFILGFLLQYPLAKHKNLLIHCTPQTRECGVHAVDDGPVQEIMQPCKYDIRKLVQLCETTKSAMPDTAYSVHSIHCHLILAFIRKGSFSCTQMFQVKTACLKNRRCIHFHGDGKVRVRKFDIFLSLQRRTSARCFTTIVALGCK